MNPLIILAIVASFPVAPKTSQALKALAPVFPQVNEYMYNVESSFQNCLDKNWCEKTGLVYTTTPDKVRSSEDCVNGMFHWYKGIPGGYGQGMGDCALIEGTMLSGIVQKWQCETDRKAKERLKKQGAIIARGLFNLAELHGIKGFVARGICADDGRSICSLSSNDQYTHWEHGLWQYYISGMASEEEKEEYRRLVVEVAQFMEERVIEENDWNFGLADGTIPDPRGICKLWGEKRPHAAARLIMIYCAAYIATGDTHWRDMYERYADKSLEMTLALKNMSDAALKYYPCYTFYQAMCSLELVDSYEQDPARKAALAECMAEFAERAHRRIEKADPAKPFYGMCWDGELLLTILMDPSYKMTESDIQFFKDTMEKRSDSPTMGWCRCAHVYSALWRLANRQAKHHETPAI